MDLNNINTTKDFAQYLSMIDASSDPIDLLISTENIPYKKINRIRRCGKNKTRSNKIPPPEIFENA